jgi:hypothetical protein
MNEPYFITYSNHFKFNGESFAFRKKILFNITTTPFVVIVRHRNDGSKGTIVNGEWLSWSKMEELSKGSKEINVDISHLQMYQQCHLEECFNLK